MNQNWVCCPADFHIYALVFWCLTINIVREYDSESVKFVFRLEELCSLCMCKEMYKVPEMMERHVESLSERRCDVKADVSVRRQKLMVKAECSQAQRVTNNCRSDVPPAE